MRADEMVHGLACDWRSAGLTRENIALCEYAELLTLHPSRMREPNVQQLRENGFDDSAIHDATQVISYFNYINRVADALGVEPEEFIRPWEISAADTMSGEANSS